MGGGGVPELAGLYIASVTFRGRPTTHGGWKSFRNQKGASILDRLEEHQLKGSDMDSGG